MPNEMTDAPRKADAQPEAGEEIVLPKVRVEIDSDGMDEVVIGDFFHIERMTDTNYWFRIGGEIDEDFSATWNGKRWEIKRTSP